MNAFGHYRMEHPHSLGSDVYDPIEDRILDADLTFRIVDSPKFRRN